MSEITEIQNFDEDTIRGLFGHEAAENEDIERLKQYYVKSEIYNKLKSKVSLYLLVGHKGVGKSALLKVLEREDFDDGNIAITIQPDDVLDIKQKDLEFLQRIRCWKEGLSRIILKKMLHQVNKINNDYSVWKDKILNLVKIVFKQGIESINEKYLGFDLEDLITFFQDSVISEKTIVVYLDDVDRGWKNSDNDIQNLSAMLNAVRDLQRDLKNIKFRVALRSDVYYAVRTSDETTDKIDGSVLWLKWSSHEILVMLIKRITTYLKINTLGEEQLLKTDQRFLTNYLDKIFEAKFNGRGHWQNAPTYKVLLSLIRKRPRDLIKLCTLAARQASNNKHSKIMTQDLECIFPSYSNDRLTDTVNEYSSELPEIQALLLGMKPSRKEIQNGKPCLFTRVELLEKIKNILSNHRFTFKNNRIVDANSLAAFLYKINFITARKNVNNKIDRKYYDENQYIYNQFSDFGYDYEIHPAYRWALQPDSIEDLIKSIELSD